jgi:hypothetical protein
MEVHSGDTTLSGANVFRVYLETGYQHVWVLWVEVHSGDTTLSGANVFRVYLQTGHQHVWVLWVEVHSRDTTLGCAHILRVRLGSLPGDQPPACEGAVDGSLQP